MDPIGITIGAASLLTLFKTCLELYEAIECGRNLSKDYEILATKVGIERVRLALWGSMVGLYDLPTDRSTKAGKLDTSAHTVDPRLKEPRIFRAVSDILNCMLRLFQDSGSLTRRYGLQQMTSSDLALRGSGRNVITTTFKKTYAHLHASASLIQQGSSLVTAARWAIKDKKRFERFVDDLRSFNDSLALLFPDVDVNTRVAMATEINDSTDIDGLQMIEDAVSDLAGGEQLVEAASLRITELSQYSKSVAETKETEATEDSMPDVNVDRMARQLERMEISMSKRAELRGSLIFSCWGVVGGEYYAQNHFYGIEEEDFLVERQKKAEYVKPTYQAWSLMYMSTRKRHDQCDFSRQDLESHHLSEGKYPGTNTVNGYIAELNMWIRKNNPTTEHYYSSGGALPEISLPEMGERIRRIRLQGDRFWYPDNRSADREVDELLGPARLGGSEIHDQVRDLLATLNRRRMFPDVLDGASLCTTALSTEGSLEIFLFQVLLANALHMRMQRASDIAFGNLNNRVIAAMHASERWINGVDLKFPDPEEQSDYVEIRSLVHEQQAEGLVRFAELMAWPAIGEMRRLVEEAYPKILAGENCNRHLYDWLYGLMLPGNAFVFTIMAALVAATPSIQHLESAQYYMSGLILQDRSYWRVKSVLGRVLGGMKGVRAGNGWAGPFPRPVASSTEEIADGWWRVHARDVAFNRFMPRDQPADGGRFPPFLRREENSTKADWIRGINDRSEWVVPLGPRNLSDKVEFQAIKLRKIGLTSPEPTQASTTTLQNTNEQQQPEPEQRAVLELRINDKLVEFTLYSNPIFVAAPQCVDGPHAVQKQDYEKLQNVLSVSQLPGYVHNEKRVLIIDASGQGECELAARAWCSENGQHAVLARGHGTCLACAVKAASQGGLAIGCVICTGL